MKFYKGWMAGFLAAAAGLLILSGCQGQGAAVDNNTGSQAGQNNAVQIVLKEGDIDIDGSGASASDGVVTIAKAGNYRISGVLNAGQILVDAGKEDTVELILGGVDITNTAGAPLYVKQAGDVTVRLEEGTENIFTDAENYEFAAGEDEPDGAIFSKDDLTITGSGNLKVNASYKDGIVSKDDLTVESGEIQITAVGDAIRGKDSVTILDGVFTIDAGDDGIKSSNDTEAEKGWISISGGSFSIICAKDGIQAQTDMDISGGEFDITAGGGAETVDLQNQTAPDRPDRPAADSSALETTDESCKGIKAGGSLRVTGGSFTINSADDAVHSNGDVTIEDGEFTIATGDDGVHGDGALTIGGGTIVISKSYEGLEGATVDINGGEITLSASDDGINAAGGSDTDEFQGWPGADNFAEKSSYYVRITDGSLRIDASGDGIDSNGNIYFDGGTVVVDGPVGSGDSAIDYEGECLISGGTLTAAGSAGMAMSPQESSTQNILMIYFDSQQQAGVNIQIKNEAGDTIAEMTPAKAFQSIIFSTPEITQSETYSLWTGDTQLAQVTTSSVLTRISEDGSAVSAEMGIGGGRGGMGGRAPEGMAPPSDGSGPGGRTPPSDGTAPADRTPPPNSTNQLSAAS